MPMTLSRRLLVAAASVPLFLQLGSHSACAAPLATASPTTTSAPTHFTVSVTGTGSDVILIPGLASSANVWDATTKQLALKHRVHVLQVAGFAGTPASGNASGPIIAPVVDELARYIAVNKLKSPAIIGHSMGGLIGMELALAHPGAVGRLMVVDALPFFGMVMGPDADVAKLTPMATAMRDKVASQSQAAYSATEPMVMSRLIKSDGPAAKAAVAAASASDHDVVARAFYEDMTTDLRPQMSRLSVPVTLLYPYDASTGLPQAAVDALYTAAIGPVPNHKIQRIDGSCHFIMIDQPDAFARAVEEFIK